MTEEEIQQAHLDRAATLVAEYGGDKFAVPISKWGELASKNAQDWRAHAADRDGRKAAPKPEPIPVPRRSDGSVDEAAAALAAFSGHTVDHFNDPRIGKP